MQSSERIDLSVIIVNWNLKKPLCSCLESILSTKDSLKKEVIVVDNASSDGSVAFIRERYPSVRIIEMDSNVGFSPANNRGYRHSTGNFILFLNPDTRIPENGIGKLVDYMTENPSVGVLGPRLTGEGGRLEISWGRDPNMITEFFQLLNLKTARLRFMLRWGNQVDLNTRDVDWLSGAFMLVRRKALEAMGLFDERFVMYFEDCDLCRRIRDTGYKVVYYPIVQVFHFRGMARVLDLDRVEWERRRGELLYYEKYNGKLQCLMLRGFLLVKSSIKVLFLWVIRMDSEKRRVGVHFAKKVCLLAIRSTR